MSNKLDEIAKGMAQSVSRRQALRRFGIGLAGMALACFGFGNKAAAKNYPCAAKDCNPPCPKGMKCSGQYFCYCK